MRIPMVATVVVLGLLVLPATQADAAPVTVELRGIVSALGGWHTSDFRLGEEIAVSYTFETTTPDSANEDRNTGVYTGGLLQFSVTLESGLSFTFGGGPPDQITTRNDLLHESFRNDTISITGDTPISADLVEGNAVLRMSAYWSSYSPLESPPPGLLTSDLVPTEPFVAQVGGLFLSYSENIFTWTHLVFLPVPGPASPPPTPTPIPTSGFTEGRQACVNEMNNSGEKVNKAQLRDNEKCLKDYQKEKLATSFEVCTAADRMGKVQKAQDKLVSGEYKKCDRLAEPPPFAYTDSAIVYLSAVSRASALTQEIFGNPALDAALVTESDDKKTARCQFEMLKQANKLDNTVLKEINKAKKTALKEGTIDTALALEAKLQAVFSPNDKIAKAEGKFVKGVAKQCATLQSPAVTFPGACADPDLDNVEDCVIAAARCQACLKIEAFDDLNLACDQADDGDDGNGSCP